MQLDAIKLHKISSKLKLSIKMAIQMGTWLRRPGWPWHTVAGHGVPWRAMGSPSWPWQALAGWIWQALAGHGCTNPGWSWMVLDDLAWPLLGLDRPWLAMAA